MWLLHSFKVAYMSHTHMCMRCGHVPPTPPPHHHHPGPQGKALCLIHCTAVCIAPVPPLYRLNVYRPQGPEAKRVLDAVIDACGAMQNLREGIFAYRQRFMKEAREKQRNTLLNVCLVRAARFFVNF